MKRLFILTLLVLCCSFWSESLKAQNAITYWKDGVPTIIYSPDSIFFWNAESYTPKNENEGESAEPTETEQMLMQLTSDEETAPIITYNEEDSLKYDALAQEVLAMFTGNGANGAKQRIIKKTSDQEDELAQEAIRDNGFNRFTNLKIEQQDWDSGRWGLTRYGGFETFYNTYIEQGKRHLIVVFYYKNGFPNTKTAYLKLGQVNSGKILGKTKITVGQEYAFLTVCIDEYLPNYGCVNFFPLLITECSQARNYLNPIMVKSDPIVASDWRNQYYGYEFGKINGVSVYFNKDSSKGNNNLGDGGFQCVELCKRYVKELNANIDRKLTDTWGNAINWPSARANDKIDPNEYIVYANDGKTKVREGDLIIWDYGTYGHIGVVIKATEKYISVAHQNGGTGINALPIGSTLKVEDGIVKDIKPGTNKSPIFASSHPINYFIRMNHFSEDITSYSASMTASTTNMAFGEVEVGKSSTLTFTVTNARGMSPLTISSMSLSKGEVFSVTGNDDPIAPGETREFTVTFKPAKAEDFKDRLIITSNADDNPQWVIYLSGAGIGGTPFDGQIVMERKYLVHHGGQYNVPSIVLRFDHNHFLNVSYLYSEYWNDSYCHDNPIEGVHIISVTGEGNWIGSSKDRTKDWYIAPVIVDEWVTEKLIVKMDGHVEYWMNDQYMGEELFDDLDLQNAKSVVVEVCPDGWWTGHYHYMDDFKLSTPAKSFSDNFDDGIIDTDIWQSPVNPDGVREEEGILKMEQLRTDQDFHLRSQPVPLQ